MAQDLELVSPDHGKPGKRGAEDTAAADVGSSRGSRGESSKTGQNPQPQTDRAQTSTSGDGGESPAPSPAPEPGTVPTDSSAPAPAPAPRDYVAEAVEAFIKSAPKLDLRRPQTAIENYFAAHASPELKARVIAAGKTADTCWEFIMAVARSALDERSGHIPEATVFAIAMHYFEDVPLNWRNPAKPAPKPKPATAKPAPKAKPTPKAKPAPKPKPAKRAQGYFFDLLEAKPC